MESRLSFQLSAYQACALLGLITSFFPAPASIHPGTSASEMALLQLSDHQRSCLLDLVDSLLPAPAPAPAPISPLPIVPTTERTPIIAQLDCASFDPHYGALSETASDTSSSYMHTRTPSPHWLDNSQDIRVLVSFHLRERPKEIKEVCNARFDIDLNPSDIISCVDDFVKEKLIPLINAVHIRFQPLPGDQAYLFRTVRTVGKKSIPVFIRGLNGDLHCSVQDLLEKIGSTTFCVVFDRKEPPKANIIDEKQASLAQINSGVAADAAQRTAQRATTGAAGSRGSKRARTPDLPTRRSQRTRV